MACSRSAAARTATATASCCAARVPGPPCPETERGPAGGRQVSLRILGAEPPDPFRKAENPHRAHDAPGAAPAPRRGPAPQRPAEASGNRRAAAGLPPGSAGASALGRGPDPRRVFLVPAAFESSRDGRRSGAQARDAAAALEPAAYSRKGSPRGGFHRTVHTPREFPYRATHKPQFFLQVSAAGLKTVDTRRGGVSDRPPFFPTPRVPAHCRFPLPEEPLRRARRNSKAFRNFRLQRGGWLLELLPDRARLFRARPLRTRHWAALAAPGCESPVGGGWCCLWPGRLGEGRLVSDAAEV